MKINIGKLFVGVVLCFGLFTSTSFASTIATAAVTPAVTTPGGKIFVHTAVTQAGQTNKAVTVTVNITNPGMCVTGHLPSHAGAFAFGLQSRETRLADMSLDIPPSACSGTYGVTVLVKSADGTVLASHTTTFKVMIPSH